MYMKDKIKSVRQKIKYHLRTLIPHIHILQNVIYITWIGYDFYIKR